MQTERPAYNANKEKILDAVANLQENEFLRLRTLTVRESFRMMDVEDHDIDLLLKSTREPIEYEAFNLETGERIKKKKCNKPADLWKQAGNSICCAPLYHLFRKMLIHRGPDAGDSKQLF